MYQEIKSLYSLLDSLGISEQERMQFINVLKRLEKRLRKSDFKLARTLKDKEIATNVLNQSIEELQKHKSYIEQTNIQLSHQKKIIEEKSKHKEQFFTKVSHELRTPLNGILGMTHLLTDTSLSGNQREFIDVIRLSAHNLLAIINDILEVSKINLGKTKLNINPFSIQQTVDLLYKLLTHKAENKSLELVFDIDVQLPEMVLGDGVRVYQILSNLLDNAFKFTPQGKVALHTQLKNLNEKEALVQFEVSDTGVGIPDDKLEVIFETFTQVRNDSGNYVEGTGLGLNIVKQLTELMGGEIQVHSQVHVGTTFIVSIPFPLPDHGELRVSSHQTQAEEKATSGWATKKVLLIEDNEANLLYARHLFKNWSLTFDEATTHAQAIAKAYTQKYDCLLVDVGLPDGDGIEFIKTVRSDGNCISQQTPIIILTAGGSKEEKQRADGLDIQAYLLKPFDPNNLKKHLERAFYERHGTQQTPLKEDYQQPKPTVKPDYLAHLSKMVYGNKQYMVEMIEIFLDQIPTTIANIEASLTVNDWDKVYYEAHKVKSTINIIGLMELKKIIDQINSYAYVKENVEEIPALFDSFKKMAIEEVKQLQIELNKLQNKPMSIA